LVFKEYFPNKRLKEIVTCIEHSNERSKELIGFVTGRMKLLEQLGLFKG
jgi:hypothetical protein